MAMHRTELIVSIVLAISVVVIGLKFILHEPIGFIIQEGKVIPIEGTDYFTINDLIIIVVFSWIGGMCANYLLTKKPEIIKEEKPISEEKKDEKKLSYVLGLLKHDERAIFHIILKHNGEILQKDLVAESTMSIVRVSRILDRLEKKRVIQKQRFGATNKIVVSEELK